MVRVTINGHTYDFPKEFTILDACKQKNIYIPTLCFHPDLPASGKCGLCAVRINNSTFAHACIQKIAEGMIIDTNTPEVIAKSRRAFNNFIDMSVIPPSKDIEEISKYLFPKNTLRTRESDRSNSITFEQSLCINCGRCVRMCSDVQNINALNYINPRMKTNECISCGQCITVCPTQALVETSSSQSILKALAERKILILQIAPATRVAIGEGFGLDAGMIVTGKVISAARKIGFNYVFDTNFGADLTAIEEANELLRRMNIHVHDPIGDQPTQAHRKGFQLNNSNNTNNNPLKQSMAKIQKPTIATSLASGQPGNIQLRATKSYTINPFEHQAQSDQRTNNQPISSTHFKRQMNEILTKSPDQHHESNELPQFTSCCPAWVNYVERLHHNLIPHLSSIKSPHMIVGKLVKTYFASVMGIDPKDIFMVSLMPCVAKKDEIKRMQFNGDIDAVLTAREFIQLVKDFGIDFNTLNNSQFDNLLGESTGAGQIFGASGGVAEAAVRYIHKLFTGKPIEKIEYGPLRELKAIKTATININEHQIKIAVCNGIAAAGELIESEQYKQYHFIEVMACPGGCVGGAGQPYIEKSLLFNRIKHIHQIDREHMHRTSDENETIQKLYKNFIGEPGGPIASKLFSTHYEPQESTILAQKRRMMNMPIVAYGSASGTAMKLARTVADIIGTTSITINNLSIRQLLNRKIAIFVISTIGEGEFPINARKFYEEIKQSFDELSSVKFAVLALGNQSYKYFCKAGKDLNQVLEEHLANQILPVKTIDTSMIHEFETEFEKWCQALCSKLSLKPPKIGIHLNYSLVADNDDTIVSNPLRPVGFDLATIKGRKEIANNHIDQATFYDFKLPKGVNYMTGEIIEVLPENPPEIIDKVIEALQLNPTQVYTLISNDSTHDTFIPEKVSIRQLFSQYLDLNGLPNRALARAFLEVANSEGFDILAKILDVNNSEYSKQYISDINIAEFICEFVKYGIPNIEVLVSSCPHIQPRQYMIASSPNRHSNIARLMIVTRKFGVNNKRKGLCTHYLMREDVRKVPVRIVQGSFKMPDKGTTPIVLIAVGCGIAPMLSIIQNRTPQNGLAILAYASTTSENHKDIFNIIAHEKELGTINDVLYAMAKEENSEEDNHHDLLLQSCEKLKTTLLENKATMWKYWENNRSVFYYCGIPGKIIDELKQIMLKITIEEGGLSIEEAMAICDRHPFYSDAF